MKQPIIVNGDFVYGTQATCGRCGKLSCACGPEPAENESLKAQLKTVLDRELATTARYDARIEKLLGVVREYRHEHNWCGWYAICPTCKAADLLLAGEEKGYALLAAKVLTPEKRSK